MTILEKLQRIQLELKAPKNQYNSFGKYKYRSAEDILEGIKPFEEKYSVLFKISDELREVAGKVFVHSEAKVIDLEVTDRERIVKTEFSVTLRGYLIPEAFNELAGPHTMQKYLTPKRVVIGQEVSTDIQSSLEQITEQESL